MQLSERTVFECVHHFFLSNTMTLSENIGVCSSFNKLFPKKCIQTLFFMETQHKKLQDAVVPINVCECLPAGSYLG